VEDKAVRMIVVFGLMGTLLLTFMMMFTLNQVADTQTPQIASDISRDFDSSLVSAPPANVRLTMSRDGKGVDAPRVYKLVLRPNEKVARDPRSLAVLMHRASECCAAELGAVQCAVTIRCVAELPGGGEKEATYVKELAGGAYGVGAVRAVAEAPSAAAGPSVPAKTEKR
jgi:hypothetical protein